MPSAPPYPDAVRGTGRIRLTILAKLLLTFATPTMVLFAVFAAVAHEVARGDLEAELGTRLSAIAAASALQIRGRYLVELGPGDDGDRAYLNARRKLDAAVGATGVARIYVFDRDFTSRVATDGQTPLGAKHFQAELHRHELSRVFDSGQAVSSVLFEGADGALYKAGYAPVRASESDDTIVLALGVDAPAAYFERLADLRHNLLLYGVLLALVVLAISIVVATLITRPLRRLAAAAERIGKGDLQAQVPRNSRDEIGLLAATMEEMRCELQARNQRLQMMLSGIAHEVRNPLGGIELFTGILRDEIESGDERRQHVERIDRELAYLKAVVNDFLDYARRPAPEIAAVDLAELAAEVVELVRADAQEAGIPLALEAQPARCQADAGQLRRAVLNLLRNAVQASAGAPTPAVRVTVANAEASAVVTVENRGLPIAEEVRERMFEPFFTTREKGTGLGLAFVREIMVEHGGTIDVRSDAEGTVFRIQLPHSAARS